MLGFLQKFLGKREGDNLPATGSNDADIQKAISQLPPELQDKVVNTINPAYESIHKDVKKNLDQLTAQLGRKPTFAELVAVAFKPLHQKAMENPDVKKAAEGKTDKKKLSDGNPTT